MEFIGSSASGSGASVTLTLPPETMSGDLAVVHMATQGSSISLLDSRFQLISTGPHAGYPDFSTHWCLLGNDLSPSVNIVANNSGTTALLVVYRNAGALSEVYYGTWSAQNPTKVAAVQSSDVIVGMLGRDGVLGTPDGYVQDAYINGSPLEMLAAHWPGPDVAPASTFTETSDSWRTRSFIFTTESTAIRQYPRDDAFGLGSAPRLYPPPRVDRTVGGQQ